MPQGVDAETLTARGSQDPLPTPIERATSRGAGQIEIELKDGSRVRVDADVSLASLRRVLSALRG